MSGRDDEFRRRLLAGAKIPSGGVVIDPNAIQKGPVDPRTDIPLTCTEVTFRQTWHRWVPLMQEDNGALEMKVVYLEIIDPANRTVYKYGLAPSELEDLRDAILALIEVRDHHVEVGGEVVPMREEPGDDD